MAARALRLEVDATAADALSDALLDAGAQSVTIESLDGPRPILSALFAESADAPSALRLALERCAQPTDLSFTVQPVADEDWVRTSQAQFTPFELERIWIGASWHTPPAGGKALIRVDPGLAFGTGSHPTTRLVLRFLERTLRGGERVLDYGCGSGILAIAAAKLGARDVAGTDIDPQALVASRANATLNGVAATFVAPDALPARASDVVVANILAHPLILLAPALAARTRPGGRIALSGILGSQVDEVSAAYARWFTLAAGRLLDGWVLITGTRRSDDT